MHLHKLRCVVFLKIIKSHPTDEIEMIIVVCVCCVVCVIITNYPGSNMRREIIHFIYINCNTNFHSSRNIWVPLAHNIPRSGICTVLNYKNAHLIYLYSLFIHNKKKTKIFRSRGWLLFCVWPRIKIAKHLTRSQLLKTYTKQQKFVCFCRCGDKKISYSCDNIYNIHPHKNESQQLMRETTTCMRKRNIWCLS
jgi:hypothetical protein